jgi:hypothetical protein
VITDNLKTGDLIEMKWRQRSLNDESADRYLKMVLLNPVLTNIGTVNQRLVGWNCHIFYDTHHKRKGVLPYSKHYEINWLKTCERQGNLKIISQAQLNDEAKE